AFPPGIARQTLRAASLSAQAALVALQEAWDEARLFDVDPRRIGLVIGGSNVQQRGLSQVHESHADRSRLLPPPYPLWFIAWGRGPRAWRSWTRICAACARRSSGFAAWPTRWGARRRAVNWRLFKRRRRRSPVKSMCASRWAR